MNASEQFRSLLEAGDVERLCSAWAQVAPHLPQPTTRAQAEIVMHHARTQCSGVGLRARAWSHRWLVERNLPSGLPDKLKPSAERMYPRVVSSVGISCNTRQEWLKPAVVMIRTAMEYAVQDAYADGRTEPEFVKQRMAQARALEQKRLFGKITGAL